MSIPLVLDNPTRLIIDCFIFYNEIDLLTYRLNILNDIVDFFIIVESTHTFSGKPKNLYYNENKELFEVFNNKIIHVISEPLHTFPNINYSKREQWENEFNQRNAISKGLDKLILNSDDLIIISDVDEIPDPQTITNIVRNNIPITINSLEMDFYYYNLNSKINEKWDACKIATFKNYKDNINCQTIRKSTCPKIVNGGWHLSYFGNEQYIKNKIENFSHQELNRNEYTNLEKIKLRVISNMDLFNREKTITKILEINNNYLPPDYKTYLNKFVKKI